MLLQEKSLILINQYIINLNLDFSIQNATDFWFIVHMSLVLVKKKKNLYFFKIVYLF
jgi:hypothetical protein